MIKPYHNPPHIYLDNTVYFMTARTANKKCYFIANKKKEILRNILSVTIQELQVIISAWVILSNHYHLLIKIKRKDDLAKLMQLFHGRTSYILNKIDGLTGRQIWYNYWDYCIRDEKDYYNHLNYIHINPVKHGLVGRPEDYKYSSYRQYIKRGYYQAGWGNI